jgi:hypothetical protein
VAEMGVTRKMGCSGGLSMQQRKKASTTCIDWSSTCVFVKSFVTEMNRICLVLFGMNNTIVGTYLPAIYGILLPVVLYFAGLSGTCVPTYPV